jgi:hypothetical protein
MIKSLDLWRGCVLLDRILVGIGDHGQRDSDFVDRSFVVVGSEVLVLVAQIIEHLIRDCGANLIHVIVSLREFSHECGEIRDELWISFMCMVLFVVRCISEHFSEPHASLARGVGF